MRKNKTWMVDLFNTELVMQTHPVTQIQNDEFWTSDTGTYLNFKVSSQEFIIGTAKINLYNKDDGTLVQRDMTKENNEAQYELTQEIIAHYGKWNAQVVFISGTERYTSPMVGFDVKRTLGDGAPEKLGIIRDWLVFESDAKELIATVEANEAIRASNEDARKSAEVIRSASEADRVNAEDVRAEFYEGFDGRLGDLEADKVVIKNLVTNGDFRDGLSGWVQSGGLHTEDGVTTINNASEQVTLFQDITQPKVGHKYYACILAKTNHYTSGSPVFNLQVNGYSTTAEYSHSVDSDFKLISVLPTGGFLNGVVRVIPAYYISDSSISVTNVIVIDLTRTFGAGNEPTKEWMDQLIEETGYFDEHVLDENWQVREMRRLDNTKANKVQEDWITPTLLNGWSSVSGHTPQYMKDDFGNVRFRGRVTGGLAHTRICDMPAGYRTAQPVTLPVCLPTGEISRVYINASYGPFLYTSADWISLDSINYNVGV